MMKKRTDVPLIADKNRPAVGEDDDHAHEKTVHGTLKLANKYYGL